MAEKVHGTLGHVLANTAAAKLFSLSGLFAVYKPKGPTSANVLNQLKEKLLAGTAGKGQDVTLGLGAGRPRREGQAGTGGALGGGRSG